MPRKRSLEVAKSVRAEPAPARQQEPRMQDKIRAARYYRDYQQFKLEIRDVAVELETVVEDFNTSINGRRGVEDLEKGTTLLKNVDRAGLIRTKLDQIVTVWGQKVHHLRPTHK